MQIVRGRVVRPTLQPKDTRSPDPLLPGYFRGPDFASLDPLAVGLSDEIAGDGPSNASTD